MPSDLQIEAVKVSRPQLEALWRLSQHKHLAVGDFDGRVLRSLREKELVEHGDDADFVSITTLGRTILKAYKYTPGDGGLAPPETHINSTIEALRKRIVERYHKDLRALERVAALMREEK